MRNLGFTLCFSCAMWLCPWAIVDEKPCALKFIRVAIMKEQTDTHTHIYIYMYIIHMYMYIYIYMYIYTHTASMPCGHGTISLVQKRLRSCFTAALPNLSTCFPIYKYMYIHTYTYYSKGGPRSRKVFGDLNRACFCLCCCCTSHGCPTQQVRSLCLPTLLQGAMQVRGTILVSPPRRQEK